jgi:hypothetical protein
VPLANWRLDANDIGSLKIPEMGTQALRSDVRIAANSYGQKWIRITIRTINRLRTISLQLMDSKGSQGSVFTNLTRTG